MPYPRDGVLTSDQQGREHNKDYEEEKKRQKIEEDKRIGALVFLGQSVADANSTFFDVLVTYACAETGRGLWYEKETDEFRTQPMRRYKERRKERSFKDKDPLKEMKVLKQESLGSEALTVL